MAKQSPTWKKQFQKPTRKPTKKNGTITIEITLGNTKMIGTKKKLETRCGWKNDNYFIIQIVSGNE